LGIFIFLFWGIFGFFYPLEQIQMYIVSLIKQLPGGHFEVPILAQLHSNGM
jgi:hypothetical protein